MPSGAVLPVRYLSPFKQSMRTASKTSRYRSRMPVNDSPSSHEWFEMKHTTPRPVRSAIRRSAIR